MATHKEIVVGIDLGTTNSEIAWYSKGGIEIASLDGEQIMPSVVGLAPDGTLLVGTPARNQAVVYPENTVVSIKRRMGGDDLIQLGKKSFKPQEISAMILRELKRRAELLLGHPVHKAVITVPALFSDAQRKATHEAGVIAGFEVMRILNEPTAASLAYESDKSKSRIVLVYDLGGGTFDVSIVETHDEVTEVLASHGDTRLGGDDFDKLLLNDIIETFIRKGNPDPRNNRMAMSRLIRAVIELKHALSCGPYAKIREEHLLEKDGVPIHLDMEVSRQRYEDLVRPLVEKTFDSVTKAMQDSGKKPGDLDAVLLVGGMTRTPFIEKRLAEVLGKQPRRDVHPDLAVAIGAGVLASRLSGYDDGRVLVDITPYSFGPEAAVPGPFGFIIPDHYAPVIHKGTPLPAKATAEFFTLSDDQPAWQVNIFQGENPIASRNIKIGEFIADGFSPAPAGNPILCTLELNLDGILHVTVVEKCTGLSKRIRMENALGVMAKEDMKKAKADLDSFFAAAPTGDFPMNEIDETTLDDEEEAEIIVSRNPDPPGEEEVVQNALRLIKKAENAMEKMSENDRKDGQKLISKLRDAIKTRRMEGFSETLAELDDILYFTNEA